ncbi:MAG: type II secretion system ATPase GspE [Armatimonadota bacterium]|nr:type II secretion system ATPase GspE [Armatimonadota bacterium]MDR7421766.1 type II secretion system ATPase GspE [Armatimonadota bacterium]MDR7454099.1 type II secretion system ATPase GspE [Armatimonadota bacterium]MDR7496628.1 type II secretion system ATPase GspE [Armatimonadota bacterium]
MKPSSIKTARRRVRLGELLVEAGLISQAQLQQALEQQNATGERLGKVLVSMGLATQDSIARAVASQLGIEYVNLQTATIPEDVLTALPEPLIRRYQVVPVRLEEEALVLGMVDPLDIVALDDIRRFVDRDIVQAAITPDGFQAVVNRYPALESSLDQVIQEIRPSDVGEEEPSLDRLREVVEDAPVVRLVNLMLVQAVRQGASDIHVEPQERNLRIRYRIDGTLYNVMTAPKHVQAASTSRIKIMANMNIAERRVPQDGRIELRVDNREIDLRVSSIPTTYGEKVVMRILDKRAALVGIDKLGLMGPDERRFEALITKPYGIILITGPTGSGKTTSLYAILNRLNKTEVNIITIEDPVEYQLSGISQVQINPKAGLTFASGLRSFLRQDPDIIMVGEIRDEETARIAIHAALTGHLVLSTLHTNDAPGAVARLVDMGIEPFLVSSSVIGVVAQRLVRVLCPKCKEGYTPPPEVVARYGLARPDEPPPTIYRAKGCEACNHIGYKGRIGLFEIMPMEDELRMLVVKSASADAIKRAAVGLGMRTLQHDGVAKVVAGITSLEEMLRVVFVE